MNKFEKRLKDWRYGALVYQVMVDRFAPSTTLDKKKHLYDYPRVLHPWHEKPKRGQFLDDVKYWSHELDFWGGDLASLETKIDYIASLGMDVLYLNPIPEALSNHKYDASDYLKVSKEYGSIEDLERVIKKTHESHMKMMLDGVFNHIGVSSPMYQEAKEDKQSVYRHFFDFNDTYPEGVRCWVDAPSLIELNLEHENVQDYIYKKESSVIQSYLLKGIDGWRLDVAFDIGYQYLKEITDAAHRVNPLNAVIGEIPNYPKLWLKSLDGVMNFSFREIILRLLKQTISMPFAQHMLSRIIKDAGIEGILKSWIVIDNHDVPRLNHELKTLSQQQLAWVLLMTLPGSPNVYYGSEIGMTGGDDPENRAPMDWSLVHDENDTFNFVRSLIALRKQSVALKVGDYMDLVSDRLFGFIRFTEHVDETRIVIMNTSDETIHTHMLMPMSDIMHFSKFDILHGSVEFIHVTAGILEVKLAPGSYVICQPHTSVDQSYTAYKRVNKI